MTSQLKGSKHYHQQLKQQWGRLVVVDLQLSSAEGQLVVGAAATTGAGRGITTATTGSATIRMAGPTMEPRAVMEAAEITETVGSELVSFVDPLGIKPSSVPRATSPKLCASFPKRKMSLKASGMCILVIT